MHRNKVRIRDMFTLLAILFSVASYLCTYVVE